MITENLSTLKIHKLTQAQYDRELEAGRIDENAIYLTPEEEIDLSLYATKTELNAVSTLVGDTKVSTQIANAIASKSDVGHDHDSDYDAKGAADTALASAKTYADQVKNDLLNGAGTAYDTLKELGDLIDDNQDAIDALEIVAAGKADASALTSHTGNKSNPHGVTASQVGAVPTSRTVNGKALSSNISLSASDIGADASGSANTALTNAKAYTDAEITEWVGDKTVAAQISTAIANKSDNGHTHDDRYYTESEINTKLSGKSDTGHTHSTYVNQNAFSNVVVGTTTIAADSTTDTLTLVAGSNVTITPDATNDKVTISATNTTYSAATQSAAGLMSVDDKKKLDGIATGANKITVDTALSSTSTNPVQNKVINTAITNLNTLVGDTKVSTQISNAIASKSDTGHNHDDRYYTESEVNNLLAGKAASSHGNHVPTTQTANNAVFLRNDNTWATVTPANIGAAASSHGTHVTFGTTTPKAAGTAAVGTATTVSRSDHVHPAQTNISGNAATATKATQDASGNVITSTYATKSELSAVSTLIGGEVVSKQINDALLNSQSDMLQNDSTQVDYVKNRTHWKEELGVQTLFNGTVETYYGWNAIQGVPIAIEIEVGASYSVIYDGVTYTVVGKAGADNLPYIGSDSLWNGDTYVSTEEPFCYGDGWFATSVDGTHTVVISGEAIEWHTIAKEYLPGILIRSGDGYRSEVFNDLNNNASGAMSHAEGYCTNASGDVTHTEGVCTVAAGAYQHVQGRYNIIDANSRYLHIVGNGNSENNRSNAHTIDWHGNAWFKGGIRVGGTNYEQGTSLIPLSTTITLQADSWVGDSNPWSQRVKIDDADIFSKVDLQPTAMQIIELQNEKVMLMIENDFGTTTAWAIGNKPTKDYTMQVVITWVTPA